MLLILFTLMLLALGYKSAEVTRLIDKVDTDGRSAQDIIRDALKASSGG